MIRCATTVLLLFVCALGTSAQSLVPQQHAETAADLIDGSKNPELIPDSLAFRLCFISLSEKEPTSGASERQKAFFYTAGLNDDDTSVAAAIVRTFKQRLDALTDTYNTAVLSTNDSTSDRILFASKREALVEATRQEFSIMLSAEGAKHFNGYVQREKEKIKASKSEIQQIAALRSKLTGLQRISMKSMQGGGGCSGFMDLHYNSYTSYATNSQGRNLYASTSVEGYTGEGNGSWCYGSITHQPQLLLQIGTAGGWFYGQNVIPSSQINYGQNVTLLCDLCQQPNSFSVQNGIFCTSLGGLIYDNVPFPPPVTLRIARTTYKYASILNGVCTYNANCINSQQTCGLDTITVQAPCAQTYFIAPFIVLRIGTNSSCFPITGVLSSTWLPCY